MEDVKSARIWAQWSEYFDAVQQEMFTLFHTREMWYRVNGILDVSGVERYTVVQNYLVRTYATTVCTAIRREVDIRKDTTSLTRCLMLMEKSPESFSWRRFADLYPAQGTIEQTERDARASFATFAPGGGDVVETAFVRRCIERYTEAARPVKEYADAVIAHRSRGATVEPVSVSYGAIDHALDELGAVFRIFYGLRHPGVMLASITPVVDLTFLRMFQVPWFPEGSLLPPVMDLG